MKKNSQNSEKMWQKCKFRWKKVTNQWKKNHESVNLDKKFVN